MIRTLTLALLPLALLAAACASGEGNADDVASLEPNAPPPAAVRDADIGEDAGGASDALLGALDPFQFLGGLGGPGASQEVDPSLGAALLTADDLPAGFQPMGEFSFSMPSDFGAMEMVASMFTSGDLAGNDFNAMVMSAVMALPPEALAELGDLGNLSGLGEADLAEIQAASGQAGMEFADLRVLDASDLGDGGFGMRMELDFGAFFAAFGPPEGDETLPAGIAMDMYAFLHGDHVLMTMVMWPTDRPPGVDAHDLAGTMDQRAAAGS